MRPHMCLEVAFLRCTEFAPLPLAGEGLLAGVCALVLPELLPLQCAVRAARVGTGHGRGCVVGALVCTQVPSADGAKRAVGIRACLGRIVCCDVYGRFNVAFNVDEGIQRLWFDGGHVDREIQ